MGATSEAMNQFCQSLEIRRQLILKKPLAMMDNIPCEIDEGLFLGSAESAMNKVGLKNVNVTHILTVAWKLPPAHPADFIYKVLYVADRETTNLKQHFNECFDFIDEAKRNGGHVLVHCRMGISRSVTIVVAYLMKSRGMNLSEALQYVKNKRSQATPNRGFIRQLEDFEKSLQGFYGGVGGRLGLEGSATETPCWEVDLGPGQVVDSEENEEENEKKQCKFESRAGTRRKTSNEHEKEERMNTKKKREEACVVLLTL